MQIQLKGFLQNKTSLWHRSFKGIYQQNYPISHFQNTLYFSAKITVTRGIDYINFIIIVNNCRVFTEYGNPSLLL